MVDTTPSFYYIPSMDDLRVTWGPQDWETARRQEENRLMGLVEEQAGKVRIRVPAPRMDHYLVSLRLRSGIVVRDRVGAPLYLSYIVLLPRIWYMVFDPSTQQVEKLWFRCPEEMPEVVDGERSLVLVYEQEP